MVLKSLLLLLVASPCVRASSAAVNVSFGELRGNYLNDAFQDIAEFIGVPYAQAPVGDLRFQPPRAWDAPYAGGVREASAFGKQCVSASQPSTPKGGEDCLFLNVWTPSQADNLPVMVFVHGGSFVTGTGNQFNGSLLAYTQQVVVISINYRLGSLGFLQVEAGLGNFGLADQREAFRWAQTQARAIGGDPTRITIFGESAGAISVLTHVVLPRSAGLFQRVISESGMLEAYPQAYALNNTAVFAKAAGCKTGPGLLACLQGLSWAQVKAAEDAVSAPNSDPFTNAGWNPTVDGVEVTEQPLALLKKGQYNRGVQVMAGSNTNEGTAFIFPRYLLPMSAQGYKDYLTVALTNAGHQRSAADVQKVVDFYPPASGPGVDNRALAADAVGDNTFICGTRLALRLLSTYGEQAYLYHFNQRAKANLMPKELGVYHGSELPFVFGYDVNGLTPFSTPEETALSGGMMALWGHFAAFGRPSQNAAYWPLYRNDTDQSLRLEAATALETSYRQAYCDFWEAYNDRY